MDRQDHLITELPTLSDRSASDLLDLLNALLNSLDSHYYVQITRYRRTLRTDTTCAPSDIPSDGDSPF